MAAPLLRVDDLVTAFHTDEGSLRAVDGVSFELADGETLGIVGESGCGKSVTSLSIMGLVPTPPGVIERGAIEFMGKDLLGISEREMRDIRGNEISMIFQEPMTSLNPVQRVGKQVAESIRHHRGVSAREGRKKAIEMLDLVGIPAPGKRVDSFPHELSGGMRQRVVIAMALVCEPKLLIADEPTTALDVTIQAQILELLGELKKTMGMSIIFITHDLGVVAELTDDVVVMYAGRVVERAPTRRLFSDPRHPYTKGLLQSIPGYGGNVGKKRLTTIQGMVPDLRFLPEGCRFRDRCELAVGRCAEKDPPLTSIDASRSVACYVAAEESNA